MTSPERDAPGDHRVAGIEEINIYGGSLRLSLAELAAARGLDPELPARRFGALERTVLPPYEDLVTLAANAAAPLVATLDPDVIGLLIVGTEGGVDLSKPVSTEVHKQLGLSPNVRNFETKHACFGGVAALDCALDWIRSGSHRGRKALVVAADFSRRHLGSDSECMFGGGAAAVVVSDTPKVMAFEPLKTGTWTRAEYDFFKPDARRELYDGKLSLLTYLEALTGSFEHYATFEEPPTDPRSAFQFLVYHMPFPAMAFQAHRHLMSGGREWVSSDFEARVKPSQRHACRLGSTYTASNFVGLCGLVDGAADRLRPGDRVGLFAYGSGAIGQFYSGLLQPEAVATVAARKIDAGLDSRRPITVGEYEALENLRAETTEVEEFTPPLDLPRDVFDSHYRGRGRLVLKRISGFKREYEWS